MKIQLPSKKLLQLEIENEHMEEIDKYARETILPLCREALINGQSSKLFSIKYYPQIIKALNKSGFYVDERGGYYYILPKKTLPKIRMGRHKALNVVLTIFTAYWFALLTWVFQNTVTDSLIACLGIVIWIFSYAFGNLFVSMDY